jgi:hypothetical protein
MSSVSPVSLCIIVSRPSNFNGFPVVPELEMLVIVYLYPAVEKLRVMHTSIKSQSNVLRVLFFNIRTGLGHARGKYQRDWAEGRKGSLGPALRHRDDERGPRCTFSSALRSKCRLRVFEAASGLADLRILLYINARKARL